MRFFTLFLFICLAILGFSGCDRFEYSPNQRFDQDSPRHLNKDNIQELLSRPGDDTVRFILTGDTQRSYDSDEEFVKQANQVAGLDFVLLDGDISDFGLLQEMEWVNNIYNRLKVPYIAVIGNHDYQGGGEKVYEQMYGDTNFSFTYRGLKFVCHDTNSREHYYNGATPDIAWLKDQMAATDAKKVVAIAHIPPFSAEFDKKLEREYTNVLNANNKLTCALYAHIGSTGTYHPYETQAPYITTGGLDNRQYMIFEIVNGKVSTKTVEF